MIIKTINQIYLTIIFRVTFAFTPEENFLLHPKVYEQLHSFAPLVYVQK